MSSYEIPAVTVKPGSTVIPVRRSLSTRWISVLTLVALVALWWAVTGTGMIEPLFLPPPSAVLQKGWLLVTTGYMDSTLWQHLGASLGRIGLGLGFAVLTAVPVGIAIGANRIARAALMAEPPQIDRGEVTDKGSINQRAVLKHRAAQAEALHAGTLPFIALAQGDKK